jgi:hypothetical protein
MTHAALQKAKHTKTKPTQRAGYESDVTKKQKPTLVANIMSQKKEVPAYDSLDDAVSKFLSSTKNKKSIPPSSLTKT